MALRGDGIETAMTENDAGLVPMRVYGNRMVQRLDGTESRWREGRVLRVLRIDGDGKAL